MLTRFLRTRTAELAFAVAVFAWPGFSFAGAL